MADREDYTGQKNIKPDFLSREKAQNSLKTVENSSLLPLETESVKNRENRPTFTYTGTGRSDRTKTEKSTRKVRFSLKRALPGALIIAVLGIGGFVAFSTNSLLGPHISAVYTAATDTQNAANVLRSEKLGFKLKYGRAGGFFDQAAEKTYQKLGLSRNVFRNFKQTGDDKVDAENFDQTMTEIYEGESTTRINTVEDEIETDEDGNETKKRTTTGEAVDSKTVDGVDAETKARNFLSGTTRKVASGVNAGCAVLRVGSMVSVAVAANELYQSINYFLNRMEPISKMMDGRGNASGINQDLNWFSRAETSTIIDASTGEEITTYGSPLQSEGARLILGGVQPNQTQANRFSLERLLQATLLSAATSGATYQKCNIAQSTSALISLATLAIPGGGFIRATVGLLLETTLAIGIQATIQGLLSFFIPHIATALFSNAYTTYTGTAAGELFDRGASAANTRIARSSSGQMPSSSAAALAYNSANNEVLAREAAEDRKNRSPFDLTSGNTFFGALARKFMVVGLQSDTSNIVNGFSNLTRSSLNSILGVYADGEDTSYMTTFGNCPNLEAIGAEGDIYCNPITTTDLSTIDLDQDDATYQEVISKNLEVDGDELKVKNNSELARYIIYCTERDSPFGVYDANIANSFESSLGIVGDNLPIIADVIDMVNAAQNAAAGVWATGSVCVNSAENPRWDNEIKYYQRFVEDARLLSDENGTENPVLTFKDAYYAENPLDNSRAGYLARISGLAKSDAEEVLAVMDYLEFISEYDPTLAYDFVLKPETDIKFDSDYKEHYVLINRYYFNKTREAEVA